MTNFTNFQWPIFNSTVQWCRSLALVAVALLYGLYGCSCGWTASLPCKVSWLGNSFPGAKKWVQQDIKAMVVTEDGTVYTNTEWDEAGREVGVYRDGDVIGMAGHTHGWGYNGGQAIAFNSKYLFIGQSVGNEGGNLKDTNTWPAKGLTWHGVSRRLRSDITKGAPFAGGKGGKGDTLKSCFLVVSEVPEKSKGGLVGLAADERELFVSDASASQIKVYDTETMQLIRSWPLERPGPLVLESLPTQSPDVPKLWIVQQGDVQTGPQILCYKPNGDIVPGKKIQWTSQPFSVQPTALCYFPGGSLFICDGGPAQQILYYNCTVHPPKLAGTFGEKGGIYSGVPGAFGPLKFNQPRGIGFAKGNAYVGHNGQSGGGGTVLESYRPRIVAGPEPYMYVMQGQLNWRLFGLEFVDMADVDPGSDTDVYTKEEHFRMDYSRPRGQEWSYEGFTLDRFKYPEDPRLHIWSAGAWVRRIYGAPVLFVLDMNAEYLQVYRFDPQKAGPSAFTVNPQSPSEIAVPSGLFSKRHIKQENWPPHQPAKGEWVWRDANGNGAFDSNEFDVASGADAPSLQGWWVDSAGDVWQATETQGMRKFALQGLDGQGNPIWDYAHVQSFPHPAEFKQVKRLRYYPEQDVMYLGGTTSEHKNQHWKPMGPGICCYENWRMPNRKLRWKIVAPYATGSQGHESCEPMGFDVAGDYVFVPYTGASKSTGFSTGHIEVIRTRDGSAVGSMEPPADIGEIGLQDIRECLRAHRRADGEYLVFLEEDWKAKILLYRWRPGGTN